MTYGISSACSSSKSSSNGSGVGITQFEAGSIPPLIVVLGTVAGIRNVLFTGLGI
jgi:hypothetical protein